MFQCYDENYIMSKWWLSLGPYTVVASKMKRGTGCEN